MHYGTEGCALASNLTGEAPRAMLTACVELLDAFLADLEAVNAGASRSAAAARQRRAELEPLLAGLPAPPEPERLPIARPPAPRGEPTSAPPKPVLPLRRPIGLDAGLGASAAVAGLAIAGLVVGDGLGRRAHAAALSGPEAGDGAAGVDLCEAMPSAVGCDDLRSARRLFVASGVTLGVALAATALFAGLRVRHARRARVCVVERTACRRRGPFLMAPTMGSRLACLHGPPDLACLHGPPDLACLHGPPDLKVRESDARRPAAIVDRMRPGLWSVILMMAACSTNAGLGDETATKTTSASDTTSTSDTEPTGGALR
ncbi:hypothetical protein [Nannocystis pusilla]|uniref:hypothetical protein n=1 Tax=Nannocystis pusilla TaxID=889268 RepID=UPI003B7ABFE1